MRSNNILVGTMCVFAIVACLLTINVTAQQDKPIAGQEPQEPHAQHTEHEDTHASEGWHFMQDGVAFLTVNHQATSRGATEFVSQNWWMGMGSRSIGDSTLTLKGMLSGEPATMGGNGYSALFRTEHGESHTGHPITDRQHPHDFVMQLAAVWHRPLSNRTGLTLAGGPVGEATLGPVAFMHRQSAVENPLAPLGHHTFDMTHLVKGIVAMRVDHGPFALEGSVFHGGEPDTDRWGIEVGALNSWATRAWWQPDPQWSVQVSHGFLTKSAANVRRTTVSAAWHAQSETGFTAVTAAYGRNDKDRAASGSDALFIEATHRVDSHVVYSRLEAVDVHANLLLGMSHHGGHHKPSTVLAATLGATQDLPALGNFDFSLGADVTLHRTPEPLIGIYGSRPASFNVFLRLRLPAPAMGRMRDATMMQPRGRM